MKTIIRALIALLMLGAQPYGAQASGTVRLLVGYPAGSSADIVARILADGLRVEFPAQTFVVENKPGADGAVAAKELLGSVPGSSYLLLNNGALGSVLETLDYDPLTMTPVAYLGYFDTPWILVPDSSPWKSLENLIEHARQHPGSVNFASGNNIGDRCFARLVGRGADIVRVKYPGEPRAFPDLLAGRVHAMCSIRTASQSLVESGKLRALALPDAHAFPIPRPLFGLTGPPGLSPAIAERMSRAITRILEDTAVATKLQSLGFEPVPTSPTQLRLIMKKEVADVAEEKRALDAFSKSVK